MIEDIDDIEILGTVDGLPEPADWAEPGHHSHLEACVEICDGRRLYFIFASEFENDGDGDVARIDLDAAGWRDLSALALKMADLIERSNG